TAEELSGLTATIANKDTFLRFGAERPAFLASATFKVSHDIKGRPVLSIRSTDSFTEPVINLLVDLRWHNGEVIRQYSLLLDPAGFPAATQIAAAVSPVAASLPAPAVTPIAAPATAAIASMHTTESSPASKSARKMTQVKVGAKATLRGVAWRVGARSDTDLKKTMLAIFRANLAAFDGNINRLHLGSVLTIPAAEEVEAISPEEASHEIHAQMAGWHAAPAKSRSSGAPLASGEPVLAAKAVAVAPVAPAQVVAPVAPSAADTAETAATAATAALNLRVQSLERGLHDMQGELEREHHKLLGMQAQVRYAEKAAVNEPVESPAAATTHSWCLPSVLGGIALLAGALGAIFLLMRRRITQKPAPKIDLAATDVFFEQSAKPAPRAIEEPERREPARRDPPRNTPAPRQSTTANSEEELRAAYEDTLDLSGETAILAAEIAAASGDTANLPAATVSLNAEALRQAAEPNAADAETVMLNPEALQVDATKLDYNFVDLDLTAQHVQMPSMLHEPVVVKERRTNLVDVLKMAIEREPDRSDLSMKLLETYYAAAATNRRGFLEVVQRLSRDRDRLAAGEWEKIAFMGKQIAADTALFLSEVEAEDDKLADCA
ncbi:MAG TPA: FimV/HubP family polar landmark protein, partial [Steroidobacteraceae bacterium]